MKHAIFNFWFNAIVVSATFIVLDNTNYSDVTIGHGSIKTNFIPARYCEPLTYNKNNDTVKLPSKREWQALVDKSDPTPSEQYGFLVLDCEKLYLNGNRDEINLHLTILKQLQLWAREIRPNRVIGWYGVSNYASRSTIDKIASQEALADLMDFEGPHKTAFFPSAYIKLDGSTPYVPKASWEEGQHLDFLNIKEVENLSTTGTHLSIPYIWPQYYDDKNSLVPAQEWSHILTTLQSTGYSGCIIWGGNNPFEEYDAANSGSGPWLQVTQDFLDNESRIVEK